MIQFFITGSSSGIGKALALKALKEGHKVTGISRRHIINHENYHHLNYDLADMNSYLKINFNRNREAEKLILVNNAGWLGEVKPASKINPDSFKRAYDINLLAPSVLSKMFIDQTQQTGQERMVVNISSGAGAYPVSSWSSYCASKAGINLFTQVLQADHPDVKCMAIAPGIVDTEMQGEIRRVQEQDFPDKQRFVDYKDNGELASPEKVADKIFHLLTNPDEIPDVVFSLRDVS
ncbi:MAG: SDR family NAD(P)-dependent oxidoreductase [Owenweeksia sp.]